MSSANNYPNTLRTLYQSNYVITLDELPNLKVDDQTPSSTITPTSITFDKYTPNQSDKTISIVFNGNTLNSLILGTTTLKLNVDYTLSGNNLVLKKTFLSQLPTGESSIIFHFDKGKDSVLKVSVIDSTPSATITPLNATFDKAVDKQQNINVTVNLNGLSLVSVINNSNSLVLNKDYTVSGNTIVLLKSYLSTLPLGDNKLTFQFSAGNNPVLSLNVIDTTAPVVTGNIVIQAFNGNTSASTNGISPKFKLLNTGNSDINLSNIKLRYYYTIDGEISQNFWCDWASIGSENVKGDFVKLVKPVTGADYCLEITFTASAGTLKAGQSAEIQARLAKSNWSNYNQADDYSFNASNSQYVNSEKVTGYLSNKLVWGIEP